MDRMLIKNEKELGCPHCGGEYISYFSIEIFERCEDENEGLHVVVENNSVNIDRILNENPSFRRQGVILKFFCEFCHKKSVLSIAQQKGTTLFKMS